MDGSTVLALGASEASAAVGSEEGDEGVVIGGSGDYLGDVKANSSNGNRHWATNEAVMVFEYLLNVQAERVGRTSAYATIYSN